MRLVAEKLCRSFGPRKIFGPLSFATSPGKVLGVAGANGSGKTTLVKTLVGLIRPSSGSVWLEDEARPAGRIAVRDAQTARSAGAPPTSPSTAS